MLTDIPDQRLKVCVLSPIRSVMDKYSVPICSIRVSEKACEGNGKQGFLLPLSQIHSKDAYKKLYFSIRVYHKSVEQTPRHSLITSSYLGQFRFGASV